MARSGWFNRTGENAMKQLLSAIFTLALFCLLQLNTAHAADGPYWQGLPVGQPTWQDWSPASPTPVVAPTAYPESPMLVLAEATATTPAYLYSLHKTKPNTYTGLLMQKRDWSTGKLVDEFGSNGTWSDSALPTQNYEPLSLVIGGDGYLYVLMDYYHYSFLGKKVIDEYKIQKHDPVTGALVTSFGNSGIATLDISNYQKILALPGSDGLLIVTADDDYFNATRYSYSTGAKGTTFKISDNTSFTSFADATVDSGYLYSVVNIKSLLMGMPLKYKVTKTAVSNGAKVWEKEQGNIFSGEQASSIAVDNSGAYLAGADTDGFFMFKVTDNFVRKYDIATGTLITSWGQAGGTVKLPFLSMFFHAVEQLTVKVTGNTLYLLNNGTSSVSFFIIPLSSSSSATLSRINKTTGVPDSSFADSGLAKVAKGKFPYFLLDNWGSVGIIGSDDSFTGDYIAKLGILPIPYGPLVDSGIRQKTANGIVGIAAEPEGFSTSPIRIRKNGVTYSLPLVEPTDPAAAHILIHTPQYGTKSLTKFN
jgi:hypothetical protein